VATKARCVLPGTRYLITRRCSEQRLFLRPESRITRTFEYLLGLLSSEYAIEVHAYVVMSNHYHLVITDVEGRLPDFQRDLNSMLARAINDCHDRVESFWDRRSYNAVELVGDADVIRRIGYTLANPVAAGLVGRAREWEGATSMGMKFGRAQQIARPEGFFSKEMPATAELMLTRPACREGWGSGQLEERVAEDVSRRELAARGRGKPMGMQKVMAQHWSSTPKQGASKSIGGIRPTVAAQDAEARIAALERAAVWLGRYQAALQQFVAGDREVEFPLGTWHMCARLKCKRAAT
jgi:putative transposase